MDNDIALVVQAAYKQATAGGRAVEAAIAAVKDRFAAQLGDQDDYPDVILSLARVVSATSEVPNDPRAEAEKVVRERLSLSRWEGTPCYEDREREEMKLLEVIRARALSQEADTAS